MKKVMYLLVVLSSIALYSFKNKDAKGPVFKVTKAEILCCGGLITTKKIHVVSSAGWSVFTNVGLRITDMTTAGHPVKLLINSTTSPITGDFTTTCLGLVGGYTYQIEFLDGSMGAFVGVTQTIVAPKCGKEKIVSSSSGGVANKLP